VSDIATWAAANWWLPLEGRHIILEDHQKRILRHVFTRDAAGRFPYQTVVWSEPKKSGKSELGGLVSYWVVKEEGPYAEAYHVANDLEQSKGRGFLAVARAAKRFRPVKVQVDKILLPDGGMIQALPCDYAGSAGANPTITCWDELWGYTSEDSRRLFEELAPVPTRRNSLRFITTYAGHVGESGLLEELYARGLECPPVPTLEDIDNGDGQPACRAGDGLFFFWSHKPRMPWQTPAYYGQQRNAPGFRPTTYLRLHENRWQQAESAFVDLSDWDACVGFVPDLAVDEPLLVVAVDAGLRHDAFAISVVSRHPRRREDGVAIRSCKVWEPVRGQDIDFGQPFEWLADFAREHHIVKVVYDEWQMADWASRFQVATGIWCEAFSQAGDRARADTLLYELVKSRRLLHDGSATLRQHVQNAAFRVSGQEERGRLVKARPGRRIDALVATSMGCWECLRLTL
jgi:phage terminase large subunit-like protein